MMEQEASPHPEDANGHAPGASEIAPPSGDAEALDELRRLLLGREQSKIEHIEQDLHTIQENHLRTVSEVLPEAVVRRSKQDRQLTEALQPTVEQALKQSVQRNPQTLVDALFPVIGPAIRKSIREALASMLQTINQTLEHSLSPRSIGWRIEAWRTGQPFAQIVLSRTLLYRIEQIFLIDPRTGLLLAHVLSADLEDAQDGALVSGMLTAIEDFVEDSFGADEAETLESLQVGELTVWLEAGPYALLAAVIRGIPPSELRERLRDLNEQFHLRFGPELEAFDGDAAPFEATHPLLESQLHAQYRESPSRLSPVLWLLGGLLLLAFGFWMLGFLQDRARWNHYLALLEAEPGIVVVETDHRLWGPHTVHGLRDPMATHPDTLLAQTRLDAADVRARWEPYQALDSALVMRRAARILQPPAGVTLTLNGSTLSATGTASPEWIADTRDRIPFLAGIDAYDDRALRIEALDRLQQAVERHHLRFEAGSTLLLPGQNAAVAALADSVQMLLTTADQLRRPVRIHVLGYSSQEGSAAFNQRISQQRADLLRQQLIAAGLPAHRLLAEGTGGPWMTDLEDDEASRSQNRSVHLRVRPVGDE